MKEMKILQGITKRIKSKGKYVKSLFLLLLVLILVSGCSDKTELSAQNEILNIRCGKAAGILCNIYNNIDITMLKPGNENLRRILHGINREFVLWWDPKKTYFYRQFLKGTWKIVEYVGTKVEFIEGEWEEEEEEAYEKENVKYIGRQFTLIEENIFRVTPGGFIYDYSDLINTIGWPPILEIDPPCVGAMISLEGWEEETNARFLFIDRTGKAYLKLYGYFFLVERIEETPSNELYLWEKWADKDRPWDPYY